MLTILFSALALAGCSIAHDALVNTTTCDGQKYTYRALAGFGTVPSTARDKYGDTLGSLGSAVALEPGSWTYNSSSHAYNGVLWTQPDRGWNTNGTLNYIPRVHKFAVAFAPNASASPDDPAPPNLSFEYLDTILYQAPDGAPLTGLDADASGTISFPGFPDLPVATYTGDGFGRSGSGGRRVPVDAEGLVLASDGGFWVSDEYGPYIYKFSSEGRMEEAIRPPEAYIPIRNGSESFSADSPPLYAPSLAPVPPDPSSGRTNNQGFEGLTVSPSGTTLSALLQSALIQDGGTAKSTSRYARLVQYDITSSPSVLAAEFVVPLPLYTNADGKTRVAGQSSIVALSETQFLVLARDSGAGRAQDETESVYRHVDVFDVADATDLRSLDGVDAAGGSVVSDDGVLREDVVPAAYCPWLDYNVDKELKRFGLRNGGKDSEGLLSEKWESLVVVPVLEGGGCGDGEGGGDTEEGDGDDGGQDVYILSLSDNDFITQDGYLDGGSFRYSDGSGQSVDTQALVFRAVLPAA
ncbi:esterase-like activity of phytase-domain-containing protein [Phyllosticta citribraziliensis]|uniref:Esterase-like activity of phytase-domain-containing protein n=1 Tax=Phyllosticta citribraziliensis TaxID=989973 RepID=A0ABR1LBF4_9PEZI